MHKNFAVTAMGRSGTMFLARILNSSHQWEVVHEVTKNEHNTDYREVQKRFDRDYYGEVNSYLRHTITELQVMRRGTIIRNPREIFVSMANMRNFVPFVASDHLNSSLSALDRYIRMVNDQKVIRFELMTQDDSYLQEIAEYLGVTDVAIADCDTKTKVNAIPRRIQTFDQLPEGVRVMYHNRIRWFEEEYGYENA